MPIHAADVLGILGVLAVLVAYFLLQVETIRFDSYLYLGLNAAGSLLIVISLLDSFNFPSFIIEGCWIGISLYGVIRRWLHDQNRAGR